MILQKVANSAVLPVGLADARGHLRVDFDDDDLAIAALIRTASDYVEAVTRRSLITQSYRLCLECWPTERRVVLPVSPLVAISAVKYYDAANVQQTVDGANWWAILREDSHGWLELKNGWTGPELFARSDAIAVEFTAGYGSTAATIPSAARAAILLLVGHWYSNREAAASGVVPKQIEIGVEALLWTLWPGMVIGGDY